MTGIMLALPVEAYKLFRGYKLVKHTFSFVFWIISILFIFGCAGSSLLLKLFSSCGKQGLLSSCSARTSRVEASPIAEYRLEVPELQQFQHAGSAVAAHRLWSAGSVAVVHELSSPETCGIFPNQDANSRPLHWQAGSYPLGHRGSPTYILNMRGVRHITEEKHSTLNLGKNLGVIKVFLERVKLSRDLNNKWLTAKARYREILTQAEHAYRHSDGRFGQCKGWKVIN